jgi:hypothetical protein
MPTLFALPSFAPQQTCGLVAARGDAAAADVLGVMCSAVLDADWIVLRDEHHPDWGHHLAAATDGRIVDRAGLLARMREPRSAEAIVEAIRVAAGWVIHGDAAVAEGLLHLVEASADCVDDAGAHARAAARFLVARADGVLLASSTARDLARLSLRSSSA